MAGLSQVPGSTTGSGSINDEVDSIGSCFRWESKPFIVMEEPIAIAVENSPVVDKYSKNVGTGGGGISVGVDELGSNCKVDKYGQKRCKKTIIEVYRKLDKKNCLPIPPTLPNVCGDSPVALPDVTATPTSSSGSIK